MSKGFGENISKSKKQEYTKRQLTEKRQKFYQRVERYIKTSDSVYNLKYLNQDQINNSEGNTYICISELMEGDSFLTFVNSLIRANNLHILELFGPGFANESLYSKKANSTTGYVLLSKEHEKINESKSSIVYKDVNIFDIKEFATVIKSEKRKFNLILCSPIAVLDILIKATPVEYYSAMYKYLNLIYQALGKDGIIISQVPIYNGTEILKIRSQYNTKQDLKSNSFLSKIFKVLAEKYAKSGIVLKYKKLSIKIIRNSTCPDRLPAIDLSILANL